MSAPPPRQQRRRLQDIAQLRDLGVVLSDSGTTAPTTAIVCRLDGPAETPYADKSWRVSITLPAEYPFKSPSVGFIDTLFHPNVEPQSGSVCLNALNTEWTPVYRLTDIITTLLPQLLRYPNPADPMNQIAAELWESDQAAYAARVAQSPGYTA